MTPEQYARICELFQAAAPLPKGEREQFLERACNGDGFLRAEVEKMLAGDNHDGTELALSSPLILNLKAMLPDGRWLRELVGERIGPYVLERKLGSGGMGTVYLARRTGDFRQHVAIKLIKAGHDAENTIARFRTERQVLANLNHPNIARLFDGGATDDGLPYFVMEYIDGRTIDRYCSEQQLSLPARISLLKSVVEAVQYAHERKILHRDLKPGNILVTAHGAPKIVDFGLAKHVQAWPGEAMPTPDSSVKTLGGEGDSDAPTLPPRSLTHTGAILGTPSYMAPEQADSEGSALGPAVDVYALGAVLYELITGRPPFRGETPLDTLFQVLHDEPLPPSRLHPRLPRDLETICLKCLHKDPNGRYSTAKALAEDLARFLEHKPILARAAGPLSRAAKFARRNKLLVGSALAVLATLTLGLSGTTIGLFRAWDAEAKLQVKVLDALERAAASAAQRGDWNEALRSLDDALAAGHPNVIDLSLRRARVLVALNRKSDARVELASLAQRQDLDRGQEALLRLLRGDLALSSFSDADEGLADIRRARELGLQPAEDAYARALLADTMPEALKHVQESLRLKALNRDPFQREAQNVQLALLLLQGQLGDCRGRAQTLASLTPDDPAPRVSLAWVTLFEGRTQDAHAQLSRWTASSKPSARYCKP
jgi:serine/threonine protein kinase